MIDALFLLTCEKEIMGGKIYAFIQKMNKYIISEKKIDLVIFYDKHIEADNFKNEIYSLIEHHFSNIIFINCEINEMNNREIIHKTNTNLKYGDFGYRSGSASLFYYAINFDTDKYPVILLLEWDVTFLCDYWLDIINYDISKLNNKYFIYGSKYNGKLATCDIMKNHLNGVAVYNRNDEFKKYIQKVESFHKICIKNNLYLFYGYDCILYVYNKKFRISDDLFIDSKYIINMSPNIDKNTPIDEIKKIKTLACILHQKY